MSYSCLHKSEIDYAKWDKVVSTSEGAVIYGLSWYLDAVADDWLGIVKGDYEAVMPFATVRKKGVNIIYQPFFTRYFSIYGSDIDSTVLKCFFDNIPSEYQLINFNLNVDEVGVKGFENDYFVHQELKLNFTYDELFKNFSTNAKRLIKKGKKAGMTVEKSSNVDGLIELFQSRKGNQLGFTDENYRHMKTLMENGVEKGAGEFLEAKMDGELMAVAYFFIHNNLIYYFNGSITDLGKKAGGLYFIINSMIEKFSNTEYTFDFGGSKVKEVADFYKKFGAYDVAYTSFSKNNLNWMMKKMKEIRDKIKKIS